MVALWSFGPTTIALFGPAAFAALWVSAGVVGGAIPLAWQAYREREQQARLQPAAAAAPADAKVVQYEGAVGASAAILGFVSAQACLLPMMELYVFPVPVAVPAWVGLGGFAAWSAAAALYGWMPGWGHSAHLGGMGVGVVAYLVVLRRRFRGLRVR